MLNDAKEHLETSEYKKRAKKHKQNHKDLFYENIPESVVSVQFFDTLAGLDKDVVQTINDKIAQCRNHYQLLLDKNINENERLRKQIGLLNVLSPDAYSIANLSLFEIFQAM